VVELQTPKAGGPYTISINGNNRILLEDVMIGEVWVCSGQSNMEMNVNWKLPYDDEVAKATNDKIRFFYVPKTTSEYPQEDVKAHWVVCTPDEMKSFSAAGYFFGKKLQENLNLPLGLISANWGGTPAETWTPAEWIEGDTILKNAAAKINQTEWWPVKPGYAYNAMIYPLLNYSIAGAIWYQGESNVGTASTYTSLFTTMISAWRKAWKKDFPFYFVQIAPYAGYGDNSSSAFLREAQTKTLSLPNTGMVLTSDLVDNINDIHPKMKKEVGERLADLALAKTYNQKNNDHEIPMYQNMKVEKNKIRITFSNADKGLTSKGPLTEFYIAGEDQNFVAADAKIEGNTIVVWNKNVPKPVAVRFGFRNAAMLNLYNKEGVPVNLFRTDDWPVQIVLNKK
jgi:sialate O-acetylesterase